MRKFYNLCSKKAKARLLAAILILSAMIPVHWVALADVELSQNPLLTDQSLLNPIKQTEFADWELYQPTSSEIAGEDMTKDTGFQYRRFFPIIAVKEDQAVLILLQKVDEQWAVFGVNETALNRQGLTLNQFAIDSNDAYNQAISTGLPVYFHFDDNDQTHYTLGLTATDVYTTRFDFISINKSWSSTPKPEEHLFADHFTVEFNSGFNFRFHYQIPYMELYFRMYALTGESEYDNFMTFNLSNAPFSLFDAMEECVVYSDASVSKGKILLKQFNFDGSATLCEIPEGARIMREVDFLNFTSHDWVLVVYGQMLGYLSKANVVQ